MLNHLQKLLVCLLVVVGSVSSTYSQAPQEEGEGSGGGGGQNPTFTLTATPNPILVGNTVTAIASAAPTEGWVNPTFGWSVKCKGAAGPDVFVASPRSGPPANQPWSFPYQANTVGTFVIKCQVSDSIGQSAIKEVEVTVEAPNKLEVVSGAVMKTVTGPGQVISATHEYELRKGTTAVGGGLVATCGRKIWDYGQTEPQNWEQGSTPAANPLFYFTSPRVYETRSVTIPANWDTLPVNFTLFQKLEKVKVIVPSCQAGTITTMEVVTFQMRYEVVKRSATTVEILVYVPCCS